MAGADPEIRNLAFVFFMSVLCIWGFSIISRLVDLYKTKNNMEKGGNIIKPFAEVIKTSMVDLVDEYTQGTHDAVLLPCLELPFQLLEKAARQKLLEAPAGAATSVGVGNTNNNATLGATPTATLPSGGGSSDVEAFASSNDSLFGASLGSLGASAAGYISLDCPSVCPSSLEIRVPIVLKGHNPYQTHNPPLDSRILINVDASDLALHASTFTVGSAAASAAAGGGAAGGAKSAAPVPFSSLGGSGGEVGSGLPTAGGGRGGASPNTNQLMISHHHERQYSNASSGGTHHRTDSEMVEFQESCVDGLMMKAHFVPPPRRSTSSQSPLHQRSLGVGGGDPLLVGDPPLSRTGSSTGLQGVKGIIKRGPRRSSTTPNVRMLSPQPKAGGVTSGSDLDEIVQGHAVPLRSDPLGPHDEVRGGEAEADTPTRRKLQIRRPAAASAASSAIVAPSPSQVRALHDTHACNYLLQGKLFDRSMVDQLVADATTSSSSEGEQQTLNHSIVLAVAHPVPLKASRGGSSGGGGGGRIVAYYTGELDPQLKRVHLLPSQLGAHGSNIESTSSSVFRPPNTTSAASTSSHSPRNAAGGRPPAQLRRRSSLLLHQEEKFHEEEGRRRTTSGDVITTTDDDSPLPWDTDLGVDPQVHAAVGTSFVSIGESDDSGGGDDGEVPQTEGKVTPLTPQDNTSTLPPLMKTDRTKTFEDLEESNGPDLLEVTLEPTSENLSNHVGGSPPTGGGGGGGSSNRPVHAVNFTLSYIAQGGQLYSVKEVYLEEDEDDDASTAVDGSTSAGGLMKEGSSGVFSTGSGGSGGATTAGGGSGGFQIPARGDRYLPDEAGSPTAASPTATFINAMPICTICYTNKISVITLPCRHCLMCETCCRKLSECPVCRTGIEGTVTTMMGS